MTKIFRCYSKKIRFCKQPPLSYEAARMRRYASVQDPL